MFQLHPQLQQDCEYLGRFSLCHLLWMRDANYPWAILVPDREGVKEIHELSESDQQQLMRESALLSRLMANLFHADKMNLAALGNLVPQLHIHHVVRYRTDPAWPAPVWGRVAVRPYEAAQLREIIERMSQALDREPGYRSVRSDTLDH
jgi:diadenosine tetraphosphate (Ap4A) HIT family hydrolase